MLNMRWRRVALGTLIATAAVPAAAADGDLDPSFGEGGVARIASDGVGTAALIPLRAMALPDGKLLFSGAHHYLPPENPPFETEVRGLFVRMNADGTPDGTFGAAGVVVLPDLLPGTRIQSVDAFVRLDDGSMIGAGTALGNAPTQGFVIKVGADGALDTTFGAGGAVLLPDVNLHAVAIDAQGRIVACGERSLDFVSTSTVVRLNADGSADAGFGESGMVTIPWSDGAQNGFLNDLVPTSDGGIVVAGRYAAYGPGLDSDFAIARLNGDGSFDTAFDTDGWRVFHDDARASTTNGIDRLALLADGRIVFAGYHGTGDANWRGGALSRLAPDGSTDTTFGAPETPGYLYVDVVPSAPAVDASALAIQDDGKPVVALTYFSSAEAQQFVAFRATADGALDAGFADAGVFRLDLAAPDGNASDVRAMTLQQDGRIVLAGRVIESFDPPLTDLAAVRLLNGPAGDDRIFADGFDG